MYRPFHRALAEQIGRQSDRLELLLTIHSFTPVYHGHSRSVEIGVLHGRDARFAKAMMRQQPEGATYDTRLNEPYSAADGVAHTLDLQGTKNGLLNVMIEVRNDLIRSADQQAAMAIYLADWVARTLHDFHDRGEEA